MRRWVLVLLLVVVGGCGGPSIENADRMNTYELMMAAAQSGKRLEDAGYFYVASEARFQIDKQVYPPTGTADQDPGVIKGAMNAGLGSTVGHALANDPAAYKSVTARVREMVAEV